MSEVLRESEGGSEESSSDRLNRLEERIAELTHRLDRIERWLGISPVRPSVRETARPPRHPETASIPAGEAAPPPHGPSLPGAAHEKPSAKTPLYPEKRAAVELETLLGERVALWVGSLLLFIAVAYFLALRWQAIPPWTRVMIGWIVGAVFLGAAEGLRERLSNWFVRGLSGVGIALFYLTNWAAHQRYSLISFDTAAILMVITTAVCAYLALRHDSPALLAFATIGGFLTPALLDSGGGNGKTGALAFLGYIALLNAGILVVSLSRRFRSVTFIAFAGTLILVPEWAGTLPLNEDLKILIFTFATVYFLEFLVVAIFDSVRHNRLIHKYDLVLLLAATLAYALAGQKLIQNRLGEIPSLFVLSLGLFYLALFFFIRSEAPANTLLQNTGLGLALFFMTLAVPIQLGRQNIAIVWSLEALLVAGIARTAQHGFLRRASALLWVIASIATLNALSGPGSDGWRPIDNPVALPLLVFAIASFGMGFLELSFQRKARPTTWSAVFLYSGVLAGAGMIGYDAYQAVWTLRDLFPESAPLGALAATVIALSLYTLGIFGVSLWYRVAPLQGAALSLLPVVIALPLWASISLKQETWPPFLNPRFLAFIVVALTTFAVSALIKVYPDHFSLRSSNPDLWILLPTILFTFAALNTESYFLFHRVLQRSDEFFFNMAILAFLFAVYMLVLGWHLTFPPLRVTGFLLIVFALWLLVDKSFPPVWIEGYPLFNWRGIAFLVASATLILLSAFGRAMVPSSARGEQALLSIGWVVGSIVALWGLSQETYWTVHFYRGFFSDWRRAAQLALSLLWTASAGLLMTLGFWRNLPLARWGAFSLFGFTLAKVFFYDLQFLPLAYRWLSLGVPGIVLIIVAYLYARRQSPISAP